MTDDIDDDGMSLQEATAFFSTLYYGEHHFPGKLTRFGPGWSMNHHGDAATWDGNFLTRLVFLAHDKCVRVSIMQGGPRAIKIVIHKRTSRTGSIFQRHPSLEQAMSDWREHHTLDAAASESTEAKKEGGA